MYFSNGVKSNESGITPIDEIKEQLKAELFIESEVDESELADEVGSQAMGEEDGVSPEE